MGQKYSYQTFRSFYNTSFEKGNFQTGADLGKVFLFFSFFFYSDRVVYDKY